MDFFASAGNEVAWKVTEPYVYEGVVRLLRLLSVLSKTELQTINLVETSWKALPERVIAP